jgi:hypothetical protein
VPPALLICTNASARCFAPPWAHSGFGGTGDFINGPFCNGRIIPGRPRALLPRENKLLLLLLLLLL